MSGWSRRPWTLQEAALARDRLRFQFKNGSLDLWRKAEDSVLEGYMKNSIFVKADAASASFLRFRAKPYFAGESGLFQFVWMTHSLLFRTTSKQRDEAFCLATALDLNAVEVLPFVTVEE
jgi:hypothetical protein